MDEVLLVSNPAKPPRFCKLRQSLTKYAKSVAFAPVAPKLVIVCRDVSPLKQELRLMPLALVNVAPVKSAEISLVSAAKALDNVLRSGALVLVKSTVSRDLQFAKSRYALVSFGKFKCEKSALTTPD